MAQVAGWLKPAGGMYRRDDGAWVQDWRIRTWHPSFLPELWRMLNIQPRWAKPLILPALWVYLVWKARGPRA